MIFNYKNYNNLEIFENKKFQFSLCNNGSFMIYKINLKFSIYFFPFGGYIYGNFYNDKFQDFCKIIYPNGLEEYCFVKNGIKDGKSYLFNTELIKIIYSNGIIKHKEYINFNNDNEFLNKKQNLNNKLNFVLNDRSVNIDIINNIFKFEIKDNIYIGIEFKLNYKIGIFKNNIFKGKIYNKDNTILTGQFINDTPNNNYLLYNPTNKNWYKFNLNNSKYSLLSNKNSVNKEIINSINFKLFDFSYENKDFDIKYIKFNKKELYYYKLYFTLDDINFIELLVNELKELDFLHNNTNSKVSEDKQILNKKLDEINNNLSSINLKKSWVIENFKIIETDDKILKIPEPRLTNRTNKSIENSIFKSNWQNTYSILNSCKIKNKKKFKNEMNKNLGNLKEKINKLYKNLKHKNPKLSKFKNIFYEKEHEEEIKNMKNIKILNDSKNELTFSNIDS